MDTSSTYAMSESRSSSLRVAVVAPSLEILGGQGVQAADLMKALKHEGFHVQFVPVNPSFPPGLRWLRRLPLLRTLVNQLLYLPSLWRLRHADVVHVFSASYWSFLISPAPALLAAHLLGKKALLNYHSGEAQDHLRHWGLRVHPWLRLADRIVVPSRYLRDVFNEFGYRAEVVRNIVDTSHYAFRERRPLRPRLLSARNLEALYGVDQVIEAYARVRRHCPEATLTVAGYGSEEARLKRLVHDKGLEGVRFVGRVEPKDMPALYDSHDIFLNASRVDNQPLSILEAFAAGLNVISTPTGDIPHMVRDKVTGVLVPPEDPAAMSHAVLSLLARPVVAADMARRARAEVEKYTWPQVCREWVELYERAKA